MFNKALYKNLFSYDKRVEVHYGGAGSGKTHGVLQKLLLKALYPWKSPRKILVLRKVGVTLKHSVFEHLIEIISSFGLTSFCEVRYSDMSVKLPGGAEFIFRGLDDSEKIKSFKGISDIMLEEATEFEHKDFLQLLLRLRDREHEKKQMYVLFNPISRSNWVYSEFFYSSGEPKKSDDLAVFHCTYADNRFADEQFIRQIDEMKQNNPDFYRIYGDGEFADRSGLVIPSFETALVEKRRTGLGFEPFCGIDFGFVNDPTAIIWGDYSAAEKTVRVAGEYVRRGMLNRDIYEAAVSLDIASMAMRADSAERKSIEELRRMGLRIFPAQKGKGSVLSGIGFILSNRLIVDERCQALLGELRDYSWKKDKLTGERTNTPEDKNNHCIDALRYGLEGFMRSGGSIHILH